MKKLIQWVDSNILFGLLYKTYIKIQFIDFLGSLRKKNNYNILLNYQKNYSSILAKLCDKYGSDKGTLGISDSPYSWPAHTYADLYSFLFDHCKDSVLNVFECGIGTNQADKESSMGVKGKPGASLRAWRDYFPNANIVGVDIDTSILFNEERIKTYYVDQTDADSVNKLWSDVGDVKFNLMVDDGLHTFESSITLFENSIDRISNNGLYSIEDVSLSDLARYKKYFTENNKYSVNYVSMFRPNTKLANNNIVLIRQLIKN